MERKLRKPIITVGILVGVMVIMGIKHQQWDCNMSLIPEHDWKIMKKHIPSTDYADTPHGISHTHFFGPSVAQARQRSEFHSCQARTKSIHEIWKKKRVARRGLIFWECLAGCENPPKLDIFKERIGKYRISTKNHLISTECLDWLCWENRNRKACVFVFNHEHDWGFL